MLDWQKIEKTITHFISKRTPPLAMYDLGVGSLPKDEARTLQSVYPKMKVYGCEPNPKTFVKRADDYVGDLYPIAVRNYNGVTDFYLNSEPDMSSIHPRTNNSIQVDCRTLDVIDELWKKPDRILLWLDIEGAEVEVIRSGRELLSSGRVKWINVELRWDKIAEEESNGWEVARELKSLGFTCRKVYNNQGTHEDAIFTLKEGRR